MCSIRGRSAASAILPVVPGSFNRYSLPGDCQLMLPNMQTILLRAITNSLMMQWLQRR